MSRKKNLDIFSNIGENSSYTEETLDKSLAKLDFEDNDEIDHNPNNEKDTILKDDGWNEFKIKDLEEFIDTFTHYADENTSNKIDWEKFDYNIYDKEYFAKKYPGFDDTVHEILAKCSKEKLEEHRDHVKKEITEEDFIVRFD